MNEQFNDDEEDPTPTDYGESPWIGPHLGTVTPAGEQERGEDADDGGPLDLAYLRDLLSLLQDMDVSAFSAGGLTVTFRDRAGLRLPDTKPANLVRGAEPVEDAAEFLKRDPAPDGWRNPALWPAQNGKVLKLNGELE